MAAAAKKEPYAEYIKHTPACCIHCIFLPASRQNFSDAEIAQTLDLLGNVERYPNTDLVEYGQRGQWATLRAVRSEMFVRPKSKICERHELRARGFSQIDDIYEQLESANYSVHSTPPLIHVKFARSVNMLITECEGDVCEVSHVKPCLLS
jgi:hypothetical protein